MGLVRAPDLQKCNKKAQLQNLPSCLHQDLCQTSGVVWGYGVGAKAVEGL